MKKLLALAMALLLSLSVLLGCSSQQQAKAAPAPQAKSSVSVQTGKLTDGKHKSAKVDNVKANSGKLQISEHAAYTDKEHVAAYINEFAKLPHNYITKGEARKLGWQSKGTLDKVAPGKSIGGDRFGNYEGRLPNKNGRIWKECDIDYVRGNRNAKRIVFSNDGLIYYTGDHYKSFTRLY